jgi:hypothetical protein
VREFWPRGKFSRGLFRLPFFQRDKTPDFIGFFKLARVMLKVTCQPVCGTMVKL